VDHSPLFPLTAIAGAPYTSLPAWAHPAGARGGQRPDRRVGSEKQVPITQMLAEVTDGVAYLLVVERGRIFRLGWTQSILRPRVAQTDGAAPPDDRVVRHQGVCRQRRAPRPVVENPRPFFPSQVQPGIGLAQGLSHAHHRLPILERDAGLFRVVRLLTKRGGPVPAEDAARLQEFLCPLGTILDACRRLAHLGQAYAYA
jgi:hypothetical protein